MNASGRKDRTARPLHGAVICCTSVPAEQRTQYTDFALSMGADHKLDLTSDVTHLLVGDTNTPKYKYVAREREDVIVLRPEWIEAVRKAWMADDGVDLNALEAQYKLPTFAGLTICITGFDDLNFRAKLQQTIDQEGGRYTGDLTKSVTHLIAAKAEGKKYQYAVQWQKQIVSIEWFEDSLARTMQLDETKYHPSIPAYERGVGAWNRSAKHANQPGKRSRPEQPVAEPARKLRRTASAKLSGQSDGLWADINGNADIEKAPREPLRPSKSLSAIRPEQPPVLPRQDPVQPLDQATHDPEAVSKLPRVALMSHGYLDGIYFCLENFDTRQAGILMRILLGEGATTLNSLRDLLDLEHVPPQKRFLVVPHNRKATAATEEAKQGGQCQIVTELWVEICMERKQCVPTTTYALGKLQPFNSEFQRLSVNSSGFPGIERNHVAKVIRALGAAYDEQLRPGLSVMICCSASTAINKIRHAKEWGVPVVTANWLWASLEARTPVSFQSYMLNAVDVDGAAGSGKKEAPTYVSKSSTNEDHIIGAAQVNYQRHSMDQVPTQLLPKKVQPTKVLGGERPGADFLNQHIVKVHVQERCQDQTKGQPDTTTRAEAVKVIGTELDRRKDLPLQESTGNSPPKARSSSPKKRKSLFQTLDGAGSIPEANEAEQGPEVVLRPASGPHQEPPNAGLLNDAVQGLLNQKGKPKSLTSSALAGHTNKQSLSRALSNISNASASSRARASRAGSVSSINTDGLGTELGTDLVEPARAVSAARGRGSFTGRAKARDESQTTQKPAAAEFNDPILYREDYVEEEVAPQLTQLGYEDSEEAIALRAKLAEKRRKKSRAGQEDPVREEAKERAAPERRIRDDETMLDAKWAGGRRTRHKDKTPPGLKGLNDF